MKVSEHEDKFRVSEIFYSIQGEGLYVGTPSVFLRLFGCNFTCGGFSMPRGELSDERFKVDPDEYEKYEDLPLVHTGCDSYASWDPRFKHLSPWMSYEEIGDKIEKLIDYNFFSVNRHLILTGGEPMLWQAKLPRLITYLQDRLQLSHLTIETNGTQELTEEFRNSFECLQEVVFSVSAKLPCSGEKWSDAIKPHSVGSYWAPHTRWIVYFKFVVDSDKDLIHVKSAMAEYKRNLYADAIVYLMPAGGTTKYYDENKEKICRLCMEKGFRYSPRLQIDLFGNQWGT